MSERTLIEKLRSLPPARLAEVEDFEGEAALGRTAAGNWYNPRTLEDTP